MWPNLIPILKKQPRKSLLASLDKKCLQVKSHWMNPNRLRQPRLRGHWWMNPLSKFLLSPLQESRR